MHDKKQTWVYTFAWLTWGFVLMTAVLHPTTVGGAKEQKVGKFLSVALNKHVYDTLLTALQ